MIISAVATPFAAPAPEAHAGVDGGDIVVIGLLVAAVAVPWLLRRRRARRDRAWVIERGWHLVGSDAGRAQRWRAVFGLNKRCVTTSVVVGRADGRQVASFEIGDGYGWRGYRWHVVTMSLPAPLAALEVTPEVRRGRAAGALGKQDLAFESAEFNKRWRVQADDAKLAHDLLHPRVLERLLQPDARALSLCVDGAEIACWRWGPSALGQVDRRLALLRDLVDSVPRFVWLDHGYDPGPTPPGERPSAPPLRLTWRERFDDWWAVSVSSGASRRRR